MADYQLEETIFAPITATGKRSAVCVLRISGDKAIETLNRCVKEDLYKVKSQHTFLTEINIPEGILSKDKTEPLDEVLLTLYRAPKSYTGENTVELSCHNSAYIIRRLGQLFCELGLRAAYPGEFSRRAVVHGKMTLTKAEAISDLIEAKTETQHQLALRQMKSSFAQKLDQLRKKLIAFAALIELELDFSEEDVNFAQRDTLQNTVLETQEKIAQLLESFALGRAIKEGIPIAIVGNPNAGKSTLLNALLQEERAMVSEIEGTTRDFIEETFSLNGVAYRLIDTAGLRKSDDPLEREGIKRSWQKIESAALILHLFDATTATPNSLSSERKNLQDKTLPNTQICSIANKIDKLNPSPSWLTRLSDCQISAQNNLGIDKLKEVIIQNSQLQDFDGLSQTVMLSNQRHYHHLHQSQQHLKRVAAGLQSGLSSEFIAADLKNAAEEIAAITGEITHEDVLDHIFSSFCIGK